MKQLVVARDFVGVDFEFRSDRSVKRVLKESDSYALISRTPRGIMK